MKVPANLETLEGTRVTVRLGAGGTVTGRVYAVSAEALQIELEGTEQKLPPIRHCSWPEVQSLSEAKEARGGIRRG